MVNAVQLICPLQLPGREAKTREHEHEQQPMPELQLPADGVKVFHSMQ